MVNYFKQPKECLAGTFLYPKTGNIHSKTGNIYSKSWNITFIEVLINVTSAGRQSPLQVLFRKTYR